MAQTCPEGWPKPRKSGAPKGWGRPKGGEGPKFRAFSSLPATVSLFLCLLGVLPLNFGGVFEGRDRQMCTFGLSGCRMKPRRRGLTRQPENSKRAHLSALALQTPPKFNEKTSQREERVKFPTGEGKKSAKFWAVRGGVVRRRGIKRRGEPECPKQPHQHQHPTLNSNNTQQPHTDNNNTLTTTHNNTSQKWAGQKWIGQNWIE